MREHIEIGPTPADEPCSQVGTDGYQERAHAECEAFKHQLYRLVESVHGPRGTLPQSFAIVVKGNPHDFGTYYEVAVRFNDSDEKACELAYWVENNSPTKWDEEAKKELSL